MITAAHGMMTKKIYSSPGPTELMKRYLPVACWQTSHEILTMIEQVNPDKDIDWGSVKMALSTLVSKGKVLKRKVKNAYFPLDKQMAARYEYLRNPKWPMNGGKR